MDESGGITRAHTGLDGVVWNILGQIYVPKQISSDSFAWHATFPIETFVPPHVHPLQDEYLFVLQNELDLLLDGRKQTARAGDLVRMPRGIPHGIFNNSGAVATCLFWVSPTGKLVDLFRRIHNMDRPAEVVEVARDYDIHFLPPKQAMA